jgi:hypothetical protein
MDRKLSSFARPDSRWRLSQDVYFAGLGFYTDVADAADNVVGGRFSFFDGHDLNGIGLVVRAEDHVTAGGFDIFHRAILVLENGIHIELGLAIRLE